MFDVADGAVSPPPDDHRGASRRSTNTDGPLVEDHSPDPVGDAQRPALDAEVLDELDQLAGDSDLVGELAELFLVDAADLVTLIGNSLACADSNTLARAAHQLKGSSANVGALELARLCSLLPAAGEPLDGSVIAPVLAAIRVEFSRVRSEFGERAMR
jgi:HPt (histidine-containing phosphotransfer) domain-containing protein